MNPTDEIKKFHKYFSFIKFGKYTIMTSQVREDNQYVFCFKDFHCDDLETFIKNEGKHSDVGGPFPTRHKAYEMAVDIILRTLPK